MKKLTIIAVLFVLPFSVFAQRVHSGLYLSNDTLFYKDAPFQGTRAQMLSLEPSVLNPQPDQQDVAILLEDQSCDCTDLARRTLFVQTTGNMWIYEAAQKGTEANNYYQLTDAWIDGTNLYMEITDKDGNILDYLMEL